MYKSKLKYAEKLSFIPDKIYLSIIYFIKTRKIMHWNNPKLLNEKLQWLKVYDRKPLYTKLVDKYEVKNYVADKIGAEYVIPTLGVWENAKDISWETLPDKFVLKCTHDSHSIVICNKTKGIDKKKVENFLDECLKRNLYWLAREWPYKNVEPRIIAETFLESENGKELVDYKFYCYGGKPRYFMYSVGEATHHPKNHKFNMNKKSIDQYFKKQPSIPESEVKFPNNMEEMIEIVNRLSLDCPHVRIDLFNVDGKIYFGEYTFFSGAGFINMISDDYSNYLSEKIKINNRGKNDKICDN